MCGIIVIMSNNNIITTVINGLRQLQNRGYDSAGIAYVVDSEIIIHKQATTEKNDSIDILFRITQKKLL